MSAGASRLECFALPGLPLVERGDDLAQLVLEGVERVGERLRDHDVVVVAQKIVSKAEGRVVRLDDVAPSESARDLAETVGKDPRIVELILRESTEVVRQRPGLLIVAHRLGLVMANAGIDHSNVAGDENAVLLLPEDPDASARRLRAELESRTGSRLGVIVADSFGRAWRLGTLGTAIGVSGVVSLRDLRGHPDLFGRRLEVSEQAIADEIASAASLLQGQGDEGRPLAVVRGLDLIDGEGASAGDLVRPPEEDLFR